MVLKPQLPKKKKNHRSYRSRDIEGLSGNDGFRVQDVGLRV